jgi:voltage-gated potassium channel
LILYHHKNLASGKPLMSLRKRIWNTLERTPNSQESLSVLVDIFLITLILLNVAAIILESVEKIFAAYHSAFAIFETFSIVVFSVEYILRVWSCVEAEEDSVQASIYVRRLRYLRQPMSIIDLVAILPFFLQFLLPGLDLRFLRVLRMVRIFKLTRYSDAFTILLQVFSQERKSFGAAFFILSMVTIVASCGIYVFEHKAQPEDFASIPAAMWWAVATLTTVGYGDVTPITALGRFFGGMIAIVGIGMVAMPTGILASGFNDLLRQREHEYESELSKALEDGHVTPKERHNLENLKKDLGLSEDTARILRLEAIANLPPIEIHCPHCGKTVEVPSKY